jgi:riboflavin kinase / FMN adenylyltransferase
MITLSVPAQTHFYASLAAAGAALPKRARLHLAVGMFDGVHLGHRAVIDTAAYSARRSGGLAAVLTFSPHPSRIFRPEQPVRMILDDVQKAERLRGLGLAAVVTQPFDRDYAVTPAEEFLPDVRRHLPGLHTLYVGENWRFGRDRRGDVSALVGYARALGLHVVSAPRLLGDGQPISSTRIRAALTEGRVGEANALLGYSYTTRGVVLPGKKLGRTLGFPTLNVPCDPDLRPALGVYCVQISGPRQPAPAPAVANYGLRPTVETAAREPLLELHALGPCPFDYGDEVTVEWLHFLRPERKFPDTKALAAQIATDRAEALAWWGV